MWSTLSAVKLHGERGGASNGSSRSSRESGERRWSTRYKRRKDEVKGIHWERETGRKKLRRRGEERIKQGEKEERFSAMKKERETQFDVLL